MNNKSESIHFIEIRVHYNNRTQVSFNLILSIYVEIARGLIADEMYTFLNDNGSLSVKHNSSKRKYQEINDQLLISSLRVKDCKRQSINLGMT